MAAISVRDLDDKVTALLKVRAAQHGRSMEAEVRAILTDAVLDDADDTPNLAQVLQERFAAVGGAKIQVPARTETARAADLPDLQ